MRGDVASDVVVEAGDGTAAVLGVAGDTLDVAGVVIGVQCSVEAVDPTEVVLVVVGGDQGGGDALALRDALVVAGAT